MFKKPLLWLTAITLLAGACNRDEQNVDPTEDNERITTVTIEFTNKAAATEIITATIDGLSADGTQPNSASATVSLKPNAAYSMRVLLSDKTKTPVTDISAAIKTEANEHLFVYKPTTGLNLTITPTDRDTNPAPGPYPVGLTNNVTTGAVSSGKLNVVLRHQPNVKNGTATPGTSDLDVSFDVVVK
ncbi:MAG: hypothetical protein LH609_21455 [Rudanella sp.]|nr:hypothetical protein [Rudanella sp.]